MISCLIRFTVMPKIDHDGDEYLEIRIVYDGDVKKLDLDWTVGMARLMEPELLEIGVIGIPSRRFIEKSDWAAGPPK